MMFHLVVPPETNDWVIVNLISMKSLVHPYVGQIQSVTDSGYIMKFAKKIDDKKFKWPIKDDVAEVARYQIAKKNHLSSSLTANE